MFLVYLVEFCWIRLYMYDDLLICYLGGDCIICCRFADQKTSADRNSEASEILFFVDQWMYAIPEAVK